DPAAPLAAQGYDAAMVMALALVRSGGEGGAALAEAIREVTAPGAPPVLPGDWPRARAAAMAGEVRYVGASAPIRFDAAGDTPGMILVWKARGGVWAPSRLR
ncbi:MAG: branched-chain amino acid transport system substrate-binding protein, partial [Paracoccaceae bacterium]